MAVWDLEPGCERPISKGDLPMALTGVGNLTPQEAARRARDWFGARVDEGTVGKIKIYPKDPSQPMVVIADRWGEGSDRRNAVKRLQRVGLDVLNGQTPPDSKIRSDGRSVDPHLTQKLEVPIREDSSVTTSTSPNGQPTPATPAAMPASKLHSLDYETVLGMLAEAETRDKEQREQIAVLVTTVDRLSNRVARLDELEHQNRGRYAAISKRILAAESRIDSLALQSPMTEIDRAAQERAEVTAKAVELLEALPPAVTMTSGSIAASLGMPDKGNLLGKLMATAASEGKVVALQVGAQKLYRAVPKKTEAR